MPLPPFPSRKSTSSSSRVTEVSSSKWKEMNNYSNPNPHPSSLHLRGYSKNGRKSMPSSLSSTSLRTIRPSSTSSSRKSIPIMSSSSSSRATTPLSYSTRRSFSSNDFPSYSASTSRPSSPSLPHPPRVIIPSPHPLPLPYPKSKSLKSHQLFNDLLHLYDNLHSSSSSSPSPSSFSSLSAPTDPLLQRGNGVGLLSGKRVNAEHQYVSVVKNENKVKSIKERRQFPISQNEQKRPPSHQYHTHSHKNTQRITNDNNRRKSTSTPSSATSSINDTFSYLKTKALNDSSRRGNLSSRSSSSSSSYSPSPSSHHDNHSMKSFSSTKSLNKTASHPFQRPPRPSSSTLSVSSSRHSLSRTRPLSSPSTSSSSTLHSPTHSSSSRHRILRRPSTPDNVVFVPEYINFSLSERPKWKPSGPSASPRQEKKKMQILSSSHPSSSSSSSSLSHKNKNNNPPIRTLSVSTKKKKVIPHTLILHPTQWKDIPDPSPLSSPFSKGRSTRRENFSIPLSHYDKYQREEEREREEKYKEKSRFSPQKKYHVVSNVDRMVTAGDEKTFKEKEKERDHSDNDKDDKKNDDTSIITIVPPTPHDKKEDIPSNPHDVLWNEMKSLNEKTKSIFAAPPPTIENAFYQKRNGEESKENNNNNNNYRYDRQGDYHRDQERIRELELKHNMDIPPLPASLLALPTSSSSSSSSTLTSSLPSSLKSPLKGNHGIPLSPFQMAHKMIQNEGDDNQQHLQGNKDNENQDESSASAPFLSTLHPSSPPPHRKIFEISPTPLPLSSSLSLLSSTLNSKESDSHLEEKWSHEERMRQMETKWREERERRRMAMEEMERERKERGEKREREMKMMRMRGEAEEKEGNPYGNIIVGMDKGKSQSPIKSFSSSLSHSDTLIPSVSSSSSSSSASVRSSPLRYTPSYALYDPNTHSNTDSQVNGHSTKGMMNILTGKSPRAPSISHYPYNHKVEKLDLEQNNSHQYPHQRVLGVPDSSSLLSSTSASTAEALAFIRQQRLELEKRLKDKEVNYAL